MSQVTIIVATRSQKELHRCQTMLAHAPNLKIVAHEPDLMNLFNTVEHNPPKLVMVSAELGMVAEFELIITLFKALGVRWLMFDSLEGKAAPMLQRGGGLFTVSLKGDTSELVKQIMSVVQAQGVVSTAPKPVQPSRARRHKRIILLGSSTGGIEALRNVLSHFEADCPPTIIVQHISAGFGQGLTATLARSCRARVQLFEPNLMVESGMICVVAGLDHHAVLKPANRPCLIQNTDAQMSGHRPSIDKLFLSAVPYAQHVVAAILTGMGRDGAQGLLELRNAGARTIAQDEKSSLVYGMPAAAWSIGAAMRQVPLQQIGPCLLAEATQ